MMRRSVAKREVAGCLGKVRPPREDGGGSGGCWDCWQNRGGTQRIGPTLAPGGDVAPLLRFVLSSMLKHGVFIPIGIGLSLLVIFQLN